MMGFKGRDFLAGLFALAFLFLSVSCSKSDYDMAESMDSYSGKYNAVVTVKTSSDGNVFFQLDEETSLEPVGWKNPFNGEVRALLNFTEIPGSEDSHALKVSVNQIEKISTFNAVSSASPAKAFMEENSPVIVYDDWLTSCEDGYLTLHMAAQCGTGTPDSVFSLHVDPSSPDTFYLIREKEDDGEKSWTEFIVAFRIRDFIPASEDGQVVVNLHNYSYYGLSTIPFVCVIR